MVVYIRTRLPRREEEILRGSVTNVRDDSADILLDNGTRLIGWRGPMYDKDGNEIPLETVKRDFLSQDTTALMARIAQLEQIVTQP